MMFIEPNLDGLLTVLILIMVGPSIVLAIIGGILYYNQKKKAAKVFFILAVIYLVISFGICGVLISS
ncbi:hypothetical protein [Gelidibacter maritimus]|uniref:Uncharacterized protein n=1 Tax=Gelidibacter maritimus TaxID=2761487 RepID=A0A7W2M3F4_9FLAO|nr:hypothetical protein [Gelidibacter maritimus]MBA6151985.1 hypothetical protein [Gelidibacter maritimus]